MKRLLTTAVLTGVLTFGTAVSADEVIETTDPGTTPDQFLFTFDQLFEELKLLVTFDDEKEAQLLLDFASERLAEAAAMSEEEKDGFVQEALEDYLAALEEAQEKVTEVIVEDKTDSEGADELTEELADTAEVEDDLTENAEDDLKEELEEAVEEAKVVANVVKDLDQEMVTQLREDALGYGQIAQIFWLAEASGKTVEEIAAIYTEEKVGFGQAAKQLGVHPSQMKGLASGKKQVSDEEEAEDVVTEEGTESGEVGAEDGDAAVEEGTETESEQPEDAGTEGETAETASVEQTTVQAVAVKTVKSTEKKTAAQPAIVKADEKKAAAAKKAEEQKAAAAKKAEEQKQEAAKKAEEEKKQEEAKKAEEKKREEAKKNEEKQQEEAKKAKDKKNDNSKEDDDDGQGEKSSDEGTGKGNDKKNGK